MIDERLSKKYGYSVDIIRSSKSTDRLYRLSVVQGKAVLSIKIPMNCSVNAVEAFIDQSALFFKIIVNAINSGEVDGNNMKSDWDTFDSLAGLHDFFSLEDSSESNNFANFELVSIVKKEKGFYSDNESGICPICKTTHRRFYRYYVDDSVVKVCKYCHDDIIKKTIKTKEILIKAGSSR